jgi:hypothetical protein
VLGEHEEESS